MAPVTRPAFKPLFSSCMDTFPVWVGGGGDRNVIFILRPCPKHWYLQHLCCFVQHTAQGCGGRNVVTSIHACGDHAQKAGIYSDIALLSFLYNTLCEDVEQDTLSQAYISWSASAGSVRLDKVSLAVCAETLPPSRFAHCQPLKIREFL